MIRARPVIAMVLVLLGTAACQGRSIVSGPQLVSLLYKIEIGMSREDVIRLLGEPGQQQKIEDTEFLFYFTDWINTSASIERSPIVLVNGKVIAMGKTYFQNFLKVRGLPTG